MELKKGKKFYGSVTVSERGQIAIPIEARKDFKIRAGDKLLVMGDLRKGIALAQPNFVLSMLEGTLGAAQRFETIIKRETREQGQEGEGSNSNDV